MGTDSTTSTSRRAPNRTKAMQSAGEYWVECCADCHHPGGAHIERPEEERGCRFCPDCRAYRPGDYGVWSTTTTTSRLTAGEAADLEHAEKVLAIPPVSRFELGDMADRIAELEWHLGSMVALVKLLAKP